MYLIYVLLIMRVCIVDPHLIRSPEPFGSRQMVEPALAAKMRHVTVIIDIPWIALKSLRIL